MLRKTALQLSEGQYYSIVRQSVPTTTVDSLARWATEEFGLQNPHMRAFSDPVLNVRELQVLPQLEATDPCCQVLRARMVPTVAETVYVLEYALHNGNTDQSLALRAKFKVKPRGFCYGRVIITK